MYGFVLFGMGMSLNNPYISKSGEYEVFRSWFFQDYAAIFYIRIKGYGNYEVIMEIGEMQ